MSDQVGNQNVGFLMTWLTSDVTANSEDHGQKASSDLGLHCFTRLSVHKFRIILVAHICIAVFN